MTIRTRLTLVLAATLLTPAAAHASVTVGTPTSENCFPFGCLAHIQGIGAIYQQGFNAAAFGGQTATFDTLQFQGVRAPSGAGLIDTATYAVSLYLTNSPANALGLDPAANRGTLLADFGSFTLGGAVPDLLTLTGNAFTYDPSQGNLLLQIVVTDLIAAAPDNSGTFRYAAFGGADTGRLVVGSTGASALPYGPVTTFDLVGGGVPEPASWAMLIGGMGLAGGALRRRGRASLARA